MKQTISIIAIAMMGFVAKTNAQTVKQTNVTPITNSLSTVVKLEPVNFSYEKDWLQKLKLKPSQSGFDLAQLAQVNPQLVVNQSLNYNEGKNNNKTAYLYWKSCSFPQIAEWHLGQSVLFISITKTRL